MESRSRRPHSSVRVIRYCYTNTKGLPSRKQFYDHLMGTALLFICCWLTFDPVASRIPEASALRVISVTALSREGINQRCDSPNGILLRTKTNTAIPIASFTEFGLFMTNSFAVQTGKSNGLYPSTPQEIYSWSLHRYSALLQILPKISHAEYYVISP